jgi:hypothetical protein
VTELVLESIVLLVRDLQDAVLDAKRVAEVHSRVGAGELRGPAVEALAIEELDPLGRLSFGRADEGRREEESEETTSVQNSRFLKYWKATRALSMGGPFVSSCSTK